MSFLHGGCAVSLHSLTSPRRLLIGALIMAAGPAMALSSLL